MTNHEALGNDIGKRDMGVLLISLLAEEEEGLDLREPSIELRELSSERFR